MTQRGDIQLGDQIRDILTDFTGTVVAITDWLNGCQRITVQPRDVKDGKPVDPSTFDVEQLVVVTAARPVPVSQTGGPHDEPTRHAGPRR